MMTGPALFACMVAGVTGAYFVYGVSASSPMPDTSHPSFVQSASLPPSQERNHFSGNCFFMTEKMDEKDLQAINTITERLDGAITHDELEAAQSDLEQKGHNLILCHLKNDNESAQICRDLEKGHMEEHNILGVCVQKKLLMPHEVQSLRTREVRSADNYCQVRDNLINLRKNPNHQNFKFIKQPKVLNLKKAEGRCGPFYIDSLKNEGDDIASRAWDPAIGCVPTEYEPVTYLYYRDGNPIVTTGSWQVSKAECKPVDYPGMYIPDRYIPDGYQ